MTWRDSLEGDSVYPLSKTGDHQGPGAMAASDESLVETAQSGGHWAYVELCGRYRELMFCIVQRITKNSHDTEDVLQDAWMRGFVHIRTFDGRAAFSTWLTRIAINSALMMLRKRRWHLEASLDDQKDLDLGGRPEIVEPSYGPEDALLRKERLSLVRQAIDGLPPSLRRVAELRQLTDGSLKEMATLTGISVPATKSRLARARFALRKHLEKV
jgi:RNA polymerase sigma-70 factor (ECF subfamily)